MVLIKFSKLPIIYFNFLIFLFRLYIFPLLSCSSSFLLLSLPSFSLPFPLFSIIARLFSFLLSSFPPFLSSLPSPIAFYYFFFFFLFPIYASLFFLLATRPKFLLNSSSPFVICHLSFVTTYHLSSIICHLSSVTTTLDLSHHDLCNPTVYIYLFS